MSRRGQESLQSFLVADRAELQSRLELLTDAFGAMERTLSRLLDHLCESGEIDPDADLLIQWKEAVARLRADGLRSRELPGEEPGPKATCPRCGSVIPCAGARGDTCTWCGYVFPLRCPGCARELENVKGEPGDLCLWCHHEF